MWHERWERTMKRRHFGKMAAATGLAFVGRPWHVRGADARDLRATSGKPVYFRGWQYKTDIVQSNVNRYNTTMSGHVD
jgi:hypothetical protein